MRQAKPTPTAVPRKADPFVETSDDETVYAEFEDILNVAFLSSPPVTIPAVPPRLGTQGCRTRAQVYFNQSLLDTQGVHV